MTQSIKEHVIAALRSVMKPIILLMLRNGVSYKEFALLCKSIFIEAASEDYGIRGRPTNVSRIAVLTGIDRKEVKRVKDLLQENSAAHEAQKNQDRFTRVLSAWHQEAEFVDQDRKPKILPIEGEKGSFYSLVKQFGGDVPTHALLKELVRAGVVEKAEMGVRVLSRYFFPVQMEPEALLRAAAVIGELGDTLFHNLYVADTAKGGVRKRLRFERRVSNHRINSKFRKAFYDYIDQEGQIFLERVDDWLSDHEAVNLDDKSDEDLARLGLSMFCIDNPASKDDE